MTLAELHGFTKLPEEQTWQIFVQICLALRYLHGEKNIAHRDLTPNNVLVQWHTLHVKIADFGLALQKGAGAVVSMMKSMVGTILYSCPEIVQHKPYTNKTDVWALGCLLYKMATLRDPFTGTNPLSVARKIVECDYEHLDPAQHSAMLLGTCQKILIVDPEFRPDIQEVCQLITPALVRHLEFAQRTIASHQHAGNQASAAAQRSLETAAQPAVLRLGALSPLWDDDGPGLHSEPSISVSSVRAEPLVPSGQVVSPGSETSAQCFQLLEEPLREKLQVPRRSMRNIVDPVQKVLLVAHRLAFLGQLPAPEAEAPDERLLAVQRYHQWLFSLPNHAFIMKREISRLMQRSAEVVDCSGVGGEPPAPCSVGAALAAMSITYERLSQHIKMICAEHGYHSAPDGAHAPPSDGGGKSPRP
ncbi:unnamed protein product [Polarella glacialis]|uniref:Protein kinase domain-containing protein n=1 Tax=Polarella glacialis TaxID=89957 RepID=A0A813LH20_POLGL|nr:unnamed protein product [Polarella glacialis]